MSDQELPPAKKARLESDSLTVNNINDTTGNGEEDVSGKDIEKNPIGKDIETTRDKDDGSNSVKNNKESEPSTSKYGNYVTPEELQKLREFQVLDEVKSNDEDSNDEDSESSDGKSEGLPEEEIEKMLDEDLPEGFKGAPKPKEKPYVTRQKIVLEEKGINHFEVLPLDWMMVRHCSGMPVYMHRGTRVATLSKPYFLGKGNTRRHDIPISAIPCLAYRRALEEEAKQKEIDRRIAEQIKNGTWMDDDNDKTNSNDERNDASGNIDTSNDKSSERSANVNSQDSQTNVVNNNGEIEIVCNSKSLDIDNTDGEKRTDQAAQESNNHVDKVPESSMESKNVTSQLLTEPIESTNNEPSQENPSDQSSQNQSQCPFKDLPHKKPVILPGGVVMAPPRVETVNTSWKTQHLSHEAVNDYCKRLFKFKTVNIMHFKRWADRRKYTKARKTLQYPTLPEGTKLITIPAQPANGQDNGGKATKRDWVMNMNGCSYLSVFHEYVRRALQKQPVYEFKQLENAATPYQATVYIGGMQYGVGHGSSKRQAKSAAARASIHILIPEMKDELDSHANRQPSADSGEPDFSFFDYVGIEDPRIQEFCAATSEPSPHAILRTCLLRNFGAGDRHIHTEMKKLEFQKIELTMKVGKHTATVVCKNKKQAKQRASQAILQALHPHIRSWGSLLRLYGSRSVKSCKEKKLEEQQITLLQDKARHNEPNYAVLEKLRNEMRKLKEMDEAVVPIGTLLVSDDLPTHSGSNLNNVDL